MLGLTGRLWEAAELHVVNAYMPFSFAQRANVAIITYD